jgi:hypothetical protein
MLKKQSIIDMKKLFSLILLVVFRFGYTQTIENLKHCKCEDSFEQIVPSFNGNYKRTCSGKIIEEGIFADGKKDGIWKTWSLKGNLIKIFSYTKGTPNGEVKYFYANGKKKIEGSFDNGLKSNIWTYYNDKGKIIKQGKYENGTPIGIWKVFDWKGKKELFVYDFSTENYLKKAKESHYFELAAIMQNENTEKWYILHRFEDAPNTAALMPVEGYILGNDLYVNLIEVPVDIWDTYLQYDFDVEVTIKSGEIISLKRVVINEDQTKNPMFTFLITTNNKDKLTRVDHSETSLKLLEYKIIETLWLMGPWIGKDGTIIIETGYVLNEFKNSPF